VKYGIDAIPHMLPADGDTGVILADKTIHGEKLAPAIGKALAGRKKSQRRIGFGAPSGTRPLPSGQMKALGFLAWPCAPEYRGIPHNGYGYSHPLW
jgi:hypothetical protein